MIKRWSTKTKDQSPVQPFLTDSQDAATPEKAEMIVSANESVDKKITASSSRF